MLRFAKWDIPDFVNLYSELDNPPKHTLLAFQTALSRIDKIYAPKSFADLQLSFLEDEKEVMKRLEDNAYSLSSQYNTISTILKLMGIIDAPLARVRAFQDVMKRLRERRNNEEIEQKKSIREEENWIEYTEILKKLDEEHDLATSEDAKMGKLRDYLMLCLFARQSPVRAGNFVDCLLLTDLEIEVAKELDTSNNYLLETPLGNFVFIYNQYKSAKYHGQAIRVVEEPKLVEALETYIRRFASDKKHLFWNERDKEKSMNENTFSKTLVRASERLLGKKVGVNMFRHIYITDFLNENPHLKDKLTLASDMGHTFFRQELYRRV
jgi:integrase